MAATQTDIPIKPFPGGFPLAGLVPPPTASVRPQLDALRQGRLIFQVCAACGRWRGLVAPVCPYCRDRRWEWRDSRGAGMAVSWVRYHRAYLEAFKALVPYVVLCVELDEGLRIFGRLAGTGAAPKVGLRVAAIIERWADDGLAPAFVPAMDS
jgi:uncharacterized protein